MRTRVRRTAHQLFVDPVLFENLQESLVMALEDVVDIEEQDEVIFEVIHAALPFLIVDVRRSSVTRHRDAITARDGAGCRRCKTDIGPFDVDHVIPWAISRDDSLANLQLLCRPCHIEKTKKDRVKITRHRRKKAAE